MRISVLGPVSINGDAGTLTHRDRVVLSGLVAGSGSAVSADSLSDALWGAQPPASSAKIVQGCVVRLRKTLGADAIETVPTGYRLAVRADDIDARRFARWSSAVVNCSHSTSPHARTLPGGAAGRRAADAASGPRHALDRARS